MINMIKDWIINLSTIIIFITSVEMILPNNSIKKYAKYVLGFLVLLAILNPLLKIMDKGFNSTEYSIKAEDYIKSNSYEKDVEKYKKKNLERTLQNFRENLALECQSILSKHYNKENFDINVIALINEKDNKIELKEVRVGISSGKIKKIKSVNVSNHKEEAAKIENLDDKKTKDIQTIIQKEFGFEKDKISVYSLDK
ncbi:stage III sporulation protein AF [Hathewaya histolytica]|uniref:stage III sporulation protein AF n=1 Tax=Hathewaya histolytica TaxID=1498 RepID=UPI003B6764F2